ncbi:tRNA(Arg) A34 adenosine deaminase TadA [Enterococcus rotai]|uniref:CMP deaminase n=1 Tax=Enterococcus rotai TaxID=118060 RepID=A0A0U2WP14_9ENTE|nr:nucleoside deaminase [Enterococcus rotai]ALS36998.1 CMP deaminase [Enterococcus rotai]
MNYMKMAADATVAGMEKKFGGPFGATLVRNGEVIVSVSNTMMKDTDPSAHAEMVAVREACKKLNTMDLSDCEIYATCEPCPMCVGAILWVGIKTVYYSNTREDAAKHGFSDMHLRNYLNGTDQSPLAMIHTGPCPECDSLWGTFDKIMAEDVEKVGGK